MVLGGWIRTNPCRRSSSLRKSCMTTPVLIAIRLNNIHFLRGPLASKTTRNTKTEHLGREAESIFWLSMKQVSPVKTQISTFCKKVTKSHRKSTSKCIRPQVRFTWGQKPLTTGPLLKNFITLGRIFIALSHKGLSLTSLKWVRDRSRQSSARWGSVSRIDSAYWKINSNRAW